MTKKNNQVIFTHKDVNIVRAGDLINVCGKVVKYSSGSAGIPEKKTKRYSLVPIGQIQAIHRQCCK